MGEFVEFQQPFEDLPGHPDFPSYRSDQQLFRDGHQRSYATSENSYTPPPLHLTIEDSIYNLSSMNRFMLSREDPYFAGFDRPMFPQQQQQQHLLNREDMPSLRHYDGQPHIFLAAVYQRRFGSPNGTSSSRSSYNEISPNANRDRRADFGYPSVQSPTSPENMAFDDANGRNFGHQQTSNTPCCLRDIQMAPDYLPEHSGRHSFEASGYPQAIGNDHSQVFVPSSYPEDPINSAKYSDNVDDNSTEQDDGEDGSPTMNSKTEETDSDYKPDVRRPNKKRPRFSTDENSFSSPSTRPRKRSSSGTTQNSGSDGSRQSENASPGAKHDKGDRQFPCILQSYGCSSTFTSKNEWKRHISTQHLCFRVWRCDLCQESSTRPNDFNRKDLFSQHLKRMHSCPASPKGSKSKTTNGAARSKNGDDSVTTKGHVNGRGGHDLDGIHERCLIQIREPPAKLSCTFCSTDFQSQDTCEEWLEHIGRHLLEKSKARSLSGKFRAGEVAANGIGWKDDEYFRRWLIMQGLLAERVDRSGWILLDKDKGRSCKGISKQTSEEDEDAAGDEE